MLLFTFIMLVFLCLFIGLFLMLGALLFKVLYVCCIGLPVAICLSVFGLLFCITLIGIPIGKLLFGAAGFVLAPFR